MVLKDKSKVKPFGATPTVLQERHMNFEKKAFFHFGMNTFTGAEWGDGQECEKSFAPTNVDTRQWIRGIKKAGFKLAIITVKHHDGFCLWPSKYTEHTLAGSPYKDGKGDIIREFTDACHEYGIKVGLYISPWDRNSRYWGKDEYSVHYANQLNELLTSYGEIEEIWWDGAGSSETVYDWRSWYEIIKTHQPKAIMFGSLGAADYVSIRWVGNENGYTSDTHYASIDTESLRVENVKELSTGKVLGERYIPAEVDVSIRPGWFYHADQDDAVKSGRVLDDIWFNSVGRNAMMLLNFPPNRDGVVCEQDLTAAIESNDRIEKMRSINYLDGASVLADGEDISDLVKCEDAFFAAKGNNTSISISLKEEVSANVFAIGEEFTLGERIVHFTLTDGISGDVICDGTSVGRLRAVRFPERKIKELSLDIEALAEVTVSSLALWKYEAPATQECKSENKNLMDNKSAGKIVDNNMGYSVLSFGGIYSFNTVEFTTNEPCNYTVYAFDGSKFYEIASGKGEDKTVRLSLEPVSSYQIKIETDSKFPIDVKFTVGMMEEKQ